MGSIFHECCLIFSKSLKKFKFINNECLFQKYEEHFDYYFY